MARKRRRRAPGQGTSWVQGGNTWIRWHQNGRRRSKKFPGCDERTKETARRVLARIVLDLAAGGPGEADEAPTATLAELGEKWLERRQHTHRIVAGTNREQAGVAQPVHHLRVRHDAFEAEHETGAAQVREDAGMAVGRPAMRVTSEAVGAARNHHAH